MLKLLMKHYVSEIAINIFFDTLHNNFVKPKIIEQLRIHVKERFIGNMWTMEPQQDIKLVTSPEIKQEMIKLLKSEVEAELVGYKGKPISEISPLILSPYPEVIK